jgi:ribose transport system permease protein
MIEKTTPFQPRQPFFWMRFLSPPVVAILLALTLFFGSILIGRILGENVGLGQVLERGRTILHIAAYLGIIAAGQTIVVLSGGEGIDLSIGTTVTLGAMITGWICNEQEALVAPALLAAIGAGLLVGLINGAGIALFKIHPLIMTLSTSGVVGGAMFAIYRGNVRGGASPLMMQWISGSSIFGIQGIIIIWILVAILMWLLLSRTQFGKHLYAIGINREAARLSGVKVEKMVILAYMCSGFIAALGGFLLLGFTQRVYFTLGEVYLFPTIAAVVIGGTSLAGGEGTYWGTISGALVLRVIDALLTQFSLPQSARQAILGGLLVIVMLFYGRGRALRQ